MSAPGYAQADDQCATPLSADEVTAGMTDYGLTVEKGMTPTRFDAEIIGVVEDGIAPGVDMILADLDSPTIEVAGVWAGMSGSPIYSTDGRLIGAVGNGSAGTSSLAGITPADAMLDLYSYPGAQASARTSHRVTLPRVLQRRAVEKSDATAKEAREGLSPLRLPLAVTGLQRETYERLQRTLGRNWAVTAVHAPKAVTPAASAAEISPGSNFAAALSYGDVAISSIGTTTDVCDSAAVAFGHPLLHSGQTRLSAHAANAVTIAPNGQGRSVKVANLAAVVDTVDQDRLAGVRAQLGDGPPRRSYTRASV